MCPNSPPNPRPRQRHAVEDRRPADAGAPEDAQEGRRVARRAERGLGVGGGADVVAERDHLDAEVVAQGLREREASRPSR